MPLKLKHRTFPFHVKQVGTDGTFSGYASVFDKIDYYGDVIRPGAFAKSLAVWKDQGKYPPLLWQHMSYMPIGPHLNMVEDGHGLYVEAELLKDDVQQAREAYALLKRKVISGMSIGFDIPDGGMEFDGKLNVWNITEVDLWENSLVTFPANEGAQVDEVKAILRAGNMPTLAEFEDLLRDAAGFTRKQAKIIAGRGYKELLRDAEAPLRDAEDTKAIETLLEPLKSYLASTR